MRTVRATEEYALLAALDLAEHYGPDSPIKAGHIAQRTGTPPGYLVQILSKLKAAALIKTVRGPAGGYCLMRRPDLISAAQILSAVGSGPKRSRADSAAPTAAHRAIHALWQDIERNRSRLLSEISLADLAERAKELTEE